MSEVKIKKSGKTLMFFTSLPEVGGHTTITLSLLELLRSDFPNIELLIRETPGHGTSLEGISRARSLGVQITVLSRSKLHLSFQLLRLLTHSLKRRPDVFLVMGMRHLSVVLSILIHAKRSVYYHITHELTAAVRRVLSFYERFFDRLAFISPATAKDYLNQDLDSVTPIWAIQPTELESVPIRQPCVEENISFGFIGRLNEAKGSKLILEIVRKNKLACTFHVAGKGEFESDFAELSRSGPSAASTKLVYWGPFSPANRLAFCQKFFSKIDYLIVPSQDDREGIPTVILEALQFGVPVIATACGGTVAFTSRELGFCDPNVVSLIPPDLFTDALRQQVTSGRPSPQVLEQCRSYYQSYFSNPVVAQQWKSLLA